MFVHNFLHMNCSGWKDSLSPTQRSTNTRTKSTANNSRNCFISQSWQNVLIAPKYNGNNNNNNNNEMDRVKTDKQHDKGCGLHDGWD